MGCSGFTSHSDLQMFSTVGSLVGVFGGLNSEKEALQGIIHLLCFASYKCDQLGRWRAGTDQLCNVEILRDNVAGNYLE